MKNKCIIPIIFSCFVLLIGMTTGCIQYNEKLQVSEEEIKVKIQLNLKEDIGLLLIDYDVDGQKGMSGISNADKSMIAYDDIVYWEIEKQQLQNPTDSVNLTLKFIIVTEYYEPNYDFIYPEEYTISLSPISFIAEFGNIYNMTIIGDKTNGYRIILNES